MSKVATIYSDDPHNPEQILRMEGTILAIIDVKPSNAILFRGMADQLSESVLDLSASTTPFHITGTESSLKDNINYSVETVEEGKHYRLKVSNRMPIGNYDGFIRLNTDLAKKTDVLIHVRGHIEGEISARPQHILIGKLAAGQPQSAARIFVISNSNKPFEITRLTYDKDLMSVSVSGEAPQNQQGFILDVEPRIEGIPLGKPKQAALEIVTNLGNDEKVQVSVIVVNNSDQQGAVKQK